MQTLELVVKADNWEDAKHILGEVDIHEKKQSSYRSINGIFIVTSKPSTSLNWPSYKKIKDHSCVAILSDTDSKNRAKEVLSRVYEVETQLRKLLLHVSDSVEKFFEILYQASEYSRNFSNEKENITWKGKLDPITSNLTFGEVIQILSYDISLASRPITGQNIRNLLDDTPDFTTFRDKLKSKISPLCVWDIIAKDVLKTNIPWSDVDDDLGRLKGFRDDAAHHHVITEKEKDKLINKSKSILKKITPSRPLTPSELAQLKDATERFNLSIKASLDQFNAVNQAFTQQAAEVAAVMRAFSLPSNAIAHLAEQMKNMRLGYPFENNDKWQDTKNEDDEPSDNDDDKTGGYPLPKK